MQSVILLGSQDKTQHDMFGVMQWRDTGSLRRTDRQDKKMRVDFSVAEQLECTELFLWIDAEPAGSLQLRTEAWVTLQGVSATSCQTRQKKWTKASTDSWKQPCVTRLCSSWGASTTLAVLGDQHSTVWATQRPPGEHRWQLPNKSSRGNKESSSVGIQSQPRNADVKVKGSLA